MPAFPGCSNSGERCDCVSGYLAALDAVRTAPRLQASLDQMIRLSRACLPKPGGVHRVGGGYEIGPPLADEVGVAGRGGGVGTESE